MISKRVQTIFTAIVLVLFFQGVTTAAIIEKVDVDSVWSAHPVNFAIVTVKSADIQYVAYYDKNRKMTVAKRSLSSKTWQYKTLPSTTGWDSHNYIAMAVDDSGYIHISGNMHNVALLYYRSVKPASIDSFAQLSMTGTDETTVTYPVFIKNPITGELFFQYRDNASGTSVTTWNKYAVSNKKWTRITTAGFFNTDGLYSAYMTTPVLGPDGYFHIVWMWRNTPTANTNHHLSHIKSKDLINWETMSGAKLTLPITQSTAGVVVDSVAAGNGLINISFNIGWDSQNRAVIGYHKYDANSISQRWNTRWENSKWVIYQTSNWTGFKWALDLGGTLAIDISAEPVKIDASGRLVQEYYNVNSGSRMWILNESTLKPITDTLPDLLPGLDTLKEVTSTFDSMIVHLINDGDYYLRWETLPENQDQARTGTLPGANILSVYKIGTSTATVPRQISAAAAPIMTRISRNDLTIIPSTRTSRVYLYTLDGQLVAEEYLKKNATTVTFKSLPAGSYVCMVQSLNSLMQHFTVIMR